MSERISWDECWMRVAEAVAQRSPCVLRQAGSVIVTAQNRIIAVGYNGMPASLAPPPVEELFGDCRDYCARSRDNAASPGTNTYEDCASVHSETNALLVCDRRDREGGTIYVAGGMPCYTCGKAIANSGLRRVVTGWPLRQDVERADKVISLWGACGVQYTRV